MLIKQGVSDMVYLLKSGKGDTYGEVNMALVMYVFKPQMRSFFRTK